MEAGRVHCDDFRSPSSHGRRVEEPDAKLPEFDALASTLTLAVRFARSGSSPDQYRQSTQNQPSSPPDS